MNIKNPEKRLNMFFGKVDQKHIKIIASHIKGEKILDLGAGYGTTTNYITQVLKKQCIAIDLDDTSIKVAKKINKNIDYLKVNAEELPFEDNQFDTLILRDALHHFLGEANYKAVAKTLYRVLKPKGRIIFFDPNVNFMLRTLRILSAHDDEECDYETALSLLPDDEYKIIHKSFNTLYSIPLSGGYVGINFIPNSPFLHKIILGSEQLLEKFMQNKLGRILCWRYVIVAEKH